MAGNRLILVACTHDMQGVLDLTYNAIRDYADNCGARLDILTGDPGIWQHGKYRIFEAGEYDFTGIDRVLIMDADVKPKSDAPDIFDAHPSGNWMLNEMPVFPHHIAKHKEEAGQYFADCGIAVQWDHAHWWNPGVSLLDPYAARLIYRMPPWDVREKLFSIGPRKAVKNMPVVNANIAMFGVDVQPLDMRYNTFSTASACLVRDAYFVHYVCPQGVPGRNGIKEAMLTRESNPPAPEPKPQPTRYWKALQARRRLKIAQPVSETVNAGLVEPHEWTLHVVQQAHIRWILQEMTDHLVKHKPNNVRVTVSDKPVDTPDTLVYWNPYRGMIGTQPLQHARSVAFCTHPEQSDAFWGAPDCTDHIVVMADQYRRAYLDRGVPEDKIDLIYPGVDEFFRDVRLRVFNPCFMAGRPRKGRDLWYALCDTPWLHCICSDGQLSKQEVYAQYRMADVIVSTAVNKHGGEGGPMACSEALAMGKRAVMPEGIGFVDDFADNPLLMRYEAGNVDALRAALSPLYHAKVNACMPMAAYTWERWATEMWGVFDRVMQRVECGR